MDANAARSRVKTREKISFAFLYAHYRAPLVHSFLRRGYSRDLAEDCVQDVFVRIAKIDLAAVENIEAYLYTVAASVAVDYGRRTHSRLTALHDPLENLEIEGIQVSPSRVLEDKEALLQLNEILNELKPRTREIFLLNRLDGLSYTEIADQFGISPAGVHKQISKALAHLRRRFPRYE